MVLINFSNLLCYGTQKISFYYVLGHSKFRLKYKRCVHFFCRTMFKLSMQLINGLNLKLHFLNYINKLQNVLGLSNFCLRYTRWVHFFYWMMFRFGMQLKYGLKLALSKKIVINFFTLQYVLGPRKFRSRYTRWVMYTTGLKF